MTPDQEKSMMDAMHVTDLVLASLFAPDESPPRRVCKCCGESFHHADPKVHCCRECWCESGDCEWRTVKSATASDGTTFVTKQCVTCGARKEFGA